MIKNAVQAWFFVEQLHSVKHWGVIQAIAEQGKNTNTMF